MSKLYRHVFVTMTTILCKISPKETICRKCQCLFSGKKEKCFKISAEFFLTRMANVINIIGSTLFIYSIGAIFCTA